MNGCILIYFLLPCRTHLIFLVICIQFDIYRLTFLPLNQDFSLWLANLEYLKNWQNALNHQLKRPTTPMSSERPKQCFYLHYLVLIWSQLVLPLAAPEPAFAVCKTSLKPTAPELVKPAGNAAAGDARTCLLNKNHNCSNPSLNRPKTVNLLKWKKSAGLMKQPSGKKYHLPLSIGCSHATAASRQKPIVQGAKNKGKHHECFGQILPCCHSPCFSLRYLVYAVSWPARFNCCRSYQRAFGGDF